MSAVQITVTHYETTAEKAQVETRNPARNPTLEPRQCPSCAAKSLTFPRLSAGSAFAFAMDEQQRGDLQLQFCVVPEFAVEAASGITVRDMVKPRFKWQVLAPLPARRLSTLFQKDSCVEDYGPAKRYSLTLGTLRSRSWWVSSALLDDSESSNRPSVLVLGNNQLQLSLFVRPVSNLTVFAHTRQISIAFPDEIVVDWRQDRLSFVSLQG